MSGGQWDYAGQKIEELLREITADPEARRMWPKTIQILARLIEPIYQAEHDMDWHLSGDTESADDDKMAAAILLAAMEAVAHGDDGSNLLRGGRYRERK